MNAKWKLGLLAMSAMMLSACNSVANKSPDEMYRYSMARQFKQDSQYNFTGKIALQVLPETDEEARQNELNKLIETEKRISEWRYDDQPEMQKPAKIRERAENKLKGKEMTITHFFNHITMPITGAYDLPSGRLEMVPEIRYETRNAISSIKIPMQIDVKNASLIIDPTAVSPFLDGMKLRYDDAKGEPLNNRYVRITAPEHWRNKLPMKDIFGALPKALDESYALYGASAFTALPLDERAKKLGASHRIGLKTTPATEDKVAKAFINHLVEQLKQKQSDKTAQSNVQPEDYAKTIELLSQVHEKWDENENNEIKNMFKNIDIEVEVYVDRQGRLLSLVQTAHLPNEFTKNLAYGKKLNLYYEMDLNYNKQPVFLIQPNETNTVDLKKVFPQGQELLENFAK